MHLKELKKKTSAELVEMDGGKLDKFQIGHQAAADAVVARLEGAAYQLPLLRIQAADSDNGCTRDSS